MGMDRFNAPALPIPPDRYSQNQQRQLIRVLSLYFSQLDSDTPWHFDKVTSKEFIGGDFSGDTFTGKSFHGDGSYLTSPFQQIVSHASQVAANTTTAYAVQFDTVNFPGGITLVGGSQIHIADAGTYRFDFEIQFGSSSPGTETVDVWIRKNGVDVPNSATLLSLPSKVAPQDSISSPVQSFLGPLAAGDYLELMWHPHNTAISIEFTPAALGPPPVPAAPSVVVIVVMLQR